MNAEVLESRVGPLVERLKGGGTASESAAVREELFTIAYDRMRALGPRMIRRFPKVRRWDDTADVVQAAGLRLHRALAEVDLRDARHLLRLAALQIRRELFDLARKHCSPESFASNHETNSFESPDGIRLRTDLATARPDEAPEHMEPWARLHDAIARLTEEDRELFDLVWFLGATQQEIASLLGSSPRTVRRQWESLKRRLVRSLGDDGPAG
jgi:RNA polymerase sigma factor (sigma-70 family)